MATAFDIGVEWEAHDDDGNHLVGMDAQKATKIFLIQSASRRILHVWDLKNLPNDEHVKKAHRHNASGTLTPQSPAATQEQADAMGTTIGELPPDPNQDQGQISGSQISGEPQPTGIGQ